MKVGALAPHLCKSVAYNLVATHVLRQREADHIARRLQRTARLSKRTVLGAPPLCQGHSSRNVHAGSGASDNLGCGSLGRCSRRSIHRPQNPCGAHLQFITNVPAPWNRAPSLHRQSSPTYTFHTGREPAFPHASGSFDRTRAPCQDLNARRHCGLTRRRAHTGNANAR